MASSKTPLKNSDFFGKPFYRSEKNRIIAGVCGGIGEYFRIDPVLIRVVFLLFAFTGSGILLYFILWLVVPSESKVNLPAKEALRANAEEMGERLSKASKETGFKGPSLFGIFLIAFGTIMLFYESGCCQWLFDWGKIWPIVLILLGIAIVLRR